ncbi:MAG: hypothetical protein WC278_05880 [Bacilli bacterium]|jgi:hypothetical protein|nr:hypothetical protein [Candidatus ainarchaeum sp.]MDY0364059.1 hypothetical protein [Bacilli bacterium]
MNELEGLCVKITLVSSAGLIILTGRWIKSNNVFALIEVKQKPMYVSLYQIKTIQLINEEKDLYEKR